MLNHPMRRWWLGWLMVACEAPAPTPPAPAADVPDWPGYRLERLYAARTDEAIWVGGYGGAVPAESEVRIHLDDGTGPSFRADAAGRFHGTVSATRAGAAEHLRFAFADDRVMDVRLRSGATVPAWPPLSGAGHTPNDLVILSDGFGALVRSGDHAISRIHMERGLDEQSQGVRLPDTEDGDLVRRPNPWFVAPVPDRPTEVVVSAFGQRDVYLIDLQAEKILHRFRATSPVERPYQLAAAVDVDGDGTPEQSGDAFVPRNPQPVVVHGQKLFVGYAGFLRRREGATPPLYLPGVVGIFDLDAPDAPPLWVPLPFANPQELRAAPDGEILVACSGGIDHVGGGLGVLGPGGILSLRTDTHELRTLAEWADFAPGTVFADETFIYVGSLLHPVLRRVRRAAPEDETDFRLHDGAVDSVFRLAHAFGDLLLIPSHNEDAVYVLDRHRGRLSPAPFFGPIQFGRKDGAGLMGLQVIARRPGRPGVDFVGPDRWLLFSGNEAPHIRPLELRRWMGP